MKKKVLSIITSCIFVLSSLAPAQNAALVNAEETSTAVKSPVTGYTLIESKYEKPGEDSISVGVPGYYQSYQKNALDRINEIRKEACDKGYPDPRDRSRKLTSSDYVPIKWSSALEEYAKIRACEAAVYSSHNRPGTNEALVEGADDMNGYIAGTTEVLAWPSYGLEIGVDMWYAEKDEWVSGGKGTTGHYTSMIDPSNTYVGLGGFVVDFDMGSSKYGSSICGRFSNIERYSSDNEALKRLQDETMPSDPKMFTQEPKVIQVINIKKEYVNNPNVTVIDRDYYMLPNKGFYLGESGTLGVVSKVKIENESSSVLSLDNYTYSSSNNKILKVEEDGTAVTKKTGKVTVKAVNSAGKEYTQNLSVTTYFRKPKVKLSSPSKKKIKAKITATKRDVENMRFFEVQTATDKKFTKNVKTTKVKVDIAPDDYNPKTTYTKTIKGLKSKKTYYVRVRTTYEVNSDSKENLKKIYSHWSSTKKIKTK